MNDEQIIEYLRSRHRGDFDPPLGATSTVMAAVDSAPSHRAWFASFMPAAAVAVIGTAFVLAVLFGAGPIIGPVPGASEEPSGPSVAPSGEAPDPQQLIECRQGT